MDAGGGRKGVDYLSFGPMSLRLTDGGNAVYTHKDHLGSPVVATDASGAVLWREAYTPFGEKWDRASSNDDRPGFTGHIDDASTQLTYMQARYYDPAIGRFLRPDPIGYQDQLNLYAYVHNDPVNATDPDGRQAALFNSPSVTRSLYGKTRVTLKAYPIGHAPLVGTYGHAYVEYGEVGSIDTRISRAGPSQPYPGGVSDAIRDRGFDGVNVDAIDTPTTVSVDNGVPGTIDVQSTEIPLAPDLVQAGMESFNEDVNIAGIEYRPRGQNSNTYAGDAFETATGIEPNNGTDITLPGLNNDLPIDENR